MSYLENPNYEIILYMLNQGESFSNSSGSSSKYSAKSDYDDKRIETGLCDLTSTHYSLMYNKTVLFWPCPSMKVRKKILITLEMVFVCGYVCACLHIPKKSLINFVF